ncbi:MAG: PqqD family protein, partial [Myxococcaceae bacterium]
MTPDAVLSRAEGVAASRLGEELVVLDSNGVMLRGLNATGGRVFELLDGTKSLTQIAAQLAREFRAPEASVLNDVVHFAAALAERRL